MGLSLPLQVWTVSDGRAGIENQVRGLAEAVSRLVSAEISRKIIGWKALLDPLPPLLHPAPLWGRSSGSSVFKAPWPDLWIAAGRASVPLSLRMRALSQGATFVVQLQDPRAPARRFDLVAPPRHDRLEGDGVFPLIGSPHRVTEERLAEARRALSPQLSALPSPRVAILIGGRSKAFNLTEGTAERLARELGAAVDAASGSLMMTFSRRTPAAAKRLLTDGLRGRPGLIWDGEGENPYLAFLAAADFIVVTQDSVNMVAEAAATGKPIYVAKVDGDQWRKRDFHADLSRRGVARPFEGRLQPYAYEPLRETERLAQEVVRRLQARRHASARNEAA